ncbi:MAG: penicillin-binding protein 2 [Candidatus Binatia bacterium]|nr:penicillin-binding protein 2 [Candidatus Binatia bacterium]MDG1957462.1 penicillin-binding protein 2 [Candidatus Binatia bacterium]MDG2009376.1 penicillin-binding protein 2 [Candidatus Binatia bacterium]
MQLNDPEPPEELRRRSRVASLVVLGFLVGLAVRLFSLQVGDGQNWQDRSDVNRIRWERIAATRGRILDTHGQPLADNRPSFDIVLVPEDTKNLDHTMAQVEDLVGRELRKPEEIRAAARKRPPFEGIVIERDIDWASIVALETNEHRLPGVRLAVGPMRTYPEGDLASHILGYVGEVSEKDLSNRQQYRPGDRIGKTGAEQMWESNLRGASGAQQIEVDARGRRLRVLSEAGGQRGESLYLTIDKRLQAFAEQLLDGQEGSIIAIRPKTGEILAMASAPGYDPNQFARGIGNTDWRALLENELRPLNNRAVQGQYPPGSTFKVVTAAAALEEEIITPESKVFCGGSHKLGNRTYRCWKRGGHGEMDLHDALAESCDVYFYQVGHKLGVDRIAAYAARFGLGEQTGIDLASEKRGLVPTRNWKKERYGESWYAGETLSVAIGQGFLLATPLQIANLAATIANGGLRMKPQLIERIESEDGETLFEMEPETRGRLGLQPKTLQQIREALRSVVHARKGTGKAARLDTIEVAGKTGTAQVFKMGKEQIKTDSLARHLRDHAWFIAFAPVENPEIAIVVLIEHAGGGGGSRAAPLAHDLADFYFSLTRGRDYQIADSGARAFPAPWDIAVPEVLAREIPAGAGTHAEALPPVDSERPGAEG